MSYITEPNVRPGDSEMACRNGPMVVCEDGADWMARMLRDTLLAQVSQWHPAPWWGRFLPTRNLNDERWIAAAASSLSSFVSILGREVGQKGYHSFLPAVLLKLAASRTNAGRKASSWKPFRHRRHAWHSMRSSAKVVGALLGMQSEWKPKGMHACVKGQKRKQGRRYPQSVFFGQKPAWKSQKRDAKRMRPAGGCPTHVFLLVISSDLKTIWQALVQAATDLQAGRRKMHICPIRSQRSHVIVASKHLFVQEATGLLECADLQEPYEIPVCMYLLCLP